MRYLLLIIISSLFLFSLISCKDEKIPPQLLVQPEKEVKKEKLNLKILENKYKEDKDISNTRGFEKNLHSIAKKVLPAVVDIRADRFQEIQSIHNFPSPFIPFTEDFFEKKRKENTDEIQSIGSGFIISKKGYIITNNHVINGAEKISVHLSNEKKYEAKLIGKDEISDLAVIKVKTDSPLPILKFADPASIQVGHFAIAVGNPFGLKGSFTFGVISALGRIEGNIDKNAVFKHFIQTDAPINQGNSGGPLVNIKGNVIGVNTAIFTSMNKGSIGIGFAIPVDVTNKVIKQLILNGRVERGYIGVQIVDLDEGLAKHYGLENNNGVLIKGVEPKGPADTADIVSGDIVLKIEEKEIKNTTDLIQIIAEFPPGKIVTFTLIHKGEMIEKSVEIAERPTRISWHNRKLNNFKPEYQKWLGLKLASVEDYKKHLSLKTDKGIVIIGVEKNSSADRAFQRFFPGDIIESINYIPVEDFNSLAIIKEKEKTEKSFLIYLLRNGKRLFSIIKVK